MAWRWGRSRRRANCIRRVPGEFYRASSTVFTLEVGKGIPNTQWANRTTLTRGELDN